MLPMLKRLEVNVQSVTSAESMAYSSRPPPCAVTEFPVKVQSSIVAVPPNAYIPPPSTEVLVLKLEPETVAPAVLSKTMPPPHRNAELAVNVQLFRFGRPFLKYAPPPCTEVEFPVNVQPVIVGDDTMA